MWPGDRQCTRGACAHAHTRSVLSPVWLLANGCILYYTYYIIFCIVFVLCIVLPRRRVSGARVCYPRTPARPLRRRTTVDADIMLSMTSAVARHCISPRCSWDRPSGLVHPDARRRHSVDGTECRRRTSGCTRPAQRSQLHRSACSAHGTLTQAPRGVVPEPGTRATGRVLFVQLYRECTQVTGLSRPRTSSPI